MRTILALLLALHSITVPRYVLRSSKPSTRLTYTGPTNGTIDFQTTTQVNFTVPGIYTFTTTNTMTLKIKGAAVGCVGGNGVTVGSGGTGGRAGAINVTGQNQSFVGATSYEIRVGTVGVAASSYVKVSGGAQIQELQDGCSGGAVLTGSGVVGSAGGGGGAYNTVGPTGSAGAVLANGAGGGGGGGTAGSAELGGGGSGGGASNGTGGHGTPPGHGDQGGNGLGGLFGVTLCGYGGGGGAGGDFGVTNGSAGGPAAVSLSFVSIP